MRAHSSCRRPSCGRSCRGLFWLESPATPTLRRHSIPGLSYCGHFVIPPPSSRGPVLSSSPMLTAFPSRGLLSCGRTPSALPESLRRAAIATLVFPIRWGIFRGHGMGRLFAACVTMGLGALSTLGALTTFSAFTTLGAPTIFYEYCTFRPCSAFAQGSLVSALPS